MVLDDVKDCAFFNNVGEEVEHQGRFTELNREGGPRAIYVSATQTGSKKALSKMNLEELKVEAGIQNIPTLDESGNFLRKVVTK
jgi:hypothetical protein